MNNKFSILILTLIILSSCQTLQDGLAGKKNKNSDEFLIEKKNPLEIPPEFGELPEPNKTKVEEEDQAEKLDKDLEKLLKNNDISNDPQSIDKSAEDFVLKQIKNN
tara:strand:- start:233 stop:550 length:318 start_codon:yes stop_codon:yes gene_type:complete